MASVPRALACAALGLLALSAACYKTRFYSGAPPVGETHEDRQWFALAGMMKLSEPAGVECGEGGVAHATVKIAVSDFFVASALTTLGGIVAFWACDESNFEDRADFATCIFASTSLPTTLLASRTVEYRCAAEPPLGTGGGQ